MSPPSGPAVSPPASIASDCSVDVSHVLKKWLESLPAGQTVLLAPGACYLVDTGIRLVDRQGLTIFGGTFRNESDSVSPGENSKGAAVFTFVGGSDIALEDMEIHGANPGGYHPHLAFDGGIELEGTNTATIRSVTIDNTFGDGITLAPLRGGADHNSGQILAPSSQVSIRDVTVSGAGRQGITLASVSGADLSDVVVVDPGLDTFDLEADQANEGARDVSIDGCEASGGLLFFANGGAGSGRTTGDITVQDCTMTTREGGSAILVERKGHGKYDRGPFTFAADRLICGESIYVACVELSGAQVTLSDVTLKFPRGKTHEAVYHLAAGSTAVFDDDVVEGYGRRGKLFGGSSAHVSGGIWTSG